MKQLFKVFGLVAAISMLPAAVFAQGRTVNTTVDGDGTFSLAGRDYSLRGVSVVLKSNGDATIYIKRPGQTWGFEGRWNRRDTDIVRVDIRDSSLGNASGTATVWLDNRWRLDRLEGSGSSNKGSWRIRFDSEASTWGGDSGGNFNGLNTTASGEGSLRLDGRSEKIRSAGVWLKPGGDFTVTFFGSMTNRFEGRWTELRRGEIALQIDRGPNRGTSGRGTVKLENNRLKSFEIDGRDSNTSFHGDFEVRYVEGGVRPPTDGPWSGTVAGRGEFRRNGDNTRIDRVRVTLERNGDAEIKLYGSKDYGFRGRWTSLGVRGWRVAITEGLSSTRTNGEALLLRTKGTGFDTLTMEGRDGDNKRYQVEFRNDFSIGDSDDNWGSWEGSSETRRGNGFLRSETGVRFDMNSAYVSMDSDGKFRLSITGEGNRTYRFAGTWRRLSDNSASLNITSGMGDLFGMGSAKGSGRIYFDGKRFSRFDFKFDEKGIDRVVEFRAN